MWDREQEHMGRSGKGVGTVPVWWGCTGRAYGRGVKMAGKDWLNLCGRGAGAHGVYEGVLLYGSGVGFKCRRWGNSVLGLAGNSIYSVRSRGGVWIVDFVEASHIRYALTINPTVYVLHIRQFWSTARVETTDAETKILATVDGKPRTISESSIRRNLKLNDEAGISSLPDVELFENLALMGYNILPNQKFTFQKGQFSHQWKYLIHTIMLCLSPKSTGFNEFSSNITTAVQYFTRARIAQSSALPTAVDEPASPLGDDSQGEAFSTVSGLEAEQDRENIIKTSALPHDSPQRVTSFAADEGREEFEDRDEAGVKRSIERGSNDTDELVNVLTSLDAARILTSGVQVVSVPPAAEVTIVSVPTGSGLVPTYILIFTTASVVTPYSRRKGKEKMVESDTPKKKKLQDQIDIARDAEIARIHAEEELQMLIDSLDRNNETIAKYLQEYEQFATDLSIEEKIDMINELVEYQDYYEKVLKYQSQQRKPLSKKQQREFYMSVLKSHSGWKTKHFKGMTLEEIKEKFIPVWKQIEDFVPMASKEEGERVKRKRLRLKQESAKKRTYWKIIGLGRHTAVYQFFVDMLKHFDREDLTQLWTLVRETLSIRQATSNKEKELWVELKRLYKPDVEDQLWTQTQALMHDPMEWRLYDTCGVHHVLSRDQEIFMLVEKDYPLRKGLSIVMISNKFQVENYSQMANDLILKIHKIANSPRQRDD
nr:hypothetical protein [Tanacetum cinerariifolium]